MVTSVSSLGRSGLYDWLVQRVSAVVLLLWFVYAGFFVVTHAPLNYELWHDFFNHTAMRVFTLAAMVSLCMHAWIGLWTISTDYLTPMMLGGKATFVRLVFQLGVLAVLAAYLVWSIQILWSL